MLQDMRIMNCKPDVRCKKCELNCKYMQVFAVLRTLHDMCIVQTWTELQAYACVRYAEDTEWHVHCEV